MQRLLPFFASFVGLCVALSAHAIGEADPTFGEQGFQRATFGNDDAPDGDVVAVGPDGKIVVAGPFGHPIFSTTIGIVRYTADGTLDTGFGKAGIAKLSTKAADFGDPDHMLIQDDRKILIVGRSKPPNSAFGFIARLDEEGELDKTFAGNGKRTASTRLRRIALQPDGKILAVSQAGRVFRFETNGDLDPTFGGDGEVDSPIAGAINGGIALQSDGKIVVGVSLPGSSVGVARLESDGSLDLGYGIGGTNSASISGSENFDLVLQPDGKSLAVVDGGAVRFDTSGAVDVGYGIGGAVSFGFPLGRPLMQADGKIVVGTGSGLRRYDIDGSIDPFYNATLPIAFPIGAQAIQPDGRVILANADPEDPEFHVGRRRGDCGNGILDPLEACDDMNLTDFDCCSSACQFDSVGSFCDADDNLCTTDTCDGAGSCDFIETAPATACHQVTLPRKSSISISNPDLSSKARLSWKWARGEATPLEALGNPVKTTDYAFCLYDESGLTPDLVARLRIPAGGTCGATDCWTPRGRPAGISGFRYRDIFRLSDGVDKFDIKPGALNKPKITLKGRGFHLPLAGSLPLGEPVSVRAQIRNGVGECWEASYSEAQTNDSDRFRAKSD